MRSIFELFAKFGTPALFVLLQAICFYLVINFNLTQNEIFLHSASVFSGKFFDQRKSFQEFLNLRTVNDELAIENAKLKERLLHYEGFGEAPQIDSLIGFKATPAKVINQTTHLRNNYLTINKGKHHDIKKDMGVMGDQGVIGVIKNVSQNYSQVISILHSASRISAKFKSKGFLGNLIWDTNDKRKLIMEAVPRYADVQKGDTIVTSGYSTIFPKGIEIGIVDDFYLESGSANYTIEVELFQEIDKLEYVYIIDDLNRQEKLSLQNGTNE